MNGERHVQITASGKERIVLGSPVNHAPVIEWVDPGSLAAVIDGPLQLRRRALDVQKRQLSDGDQATCGVPAEIGYPAIVCPAVGQAQLGVLELGLPQKTDGGVEQAELEVLLVHERNAFVRVTGAEGHVVRVAPVRCGTHVFGSHCPQKTQRAPFGAGRWPLIDLEVLVAFIVDLNAQRSRPMLLLEVVFPEIGRLEYVPVGVYRAGVGKVLDLVSHDALQA